MSDEALRKFTREIKINQNISYSEIASLLEIKRNSFYNWLKGYYSLSEERKERLYDILATLKI